MYAMFCKRLPACLGLTILLGGIAGAQTPPSAAQPDFTVLKDEFVPGEKTLLYDDFTDMRPGEAPPHWKVRGASLSVMAAGAVRQVVANRNTTLVPLVTGLPGNFTVETEIKYDGTVVSSWEFYPKDESMYALQVWLQGFGDGVRVTVQTPDEVLSDTEFPFDLSQPVREAIWLQEGRLRVYLNGNRISDANQLKLPALETAALLAEPEGEGDKVTYRMVRIAESAPDFSRTIAASGRYVTHGILFDTDCATLKAESGPVIKSIAKGLQASPNLKLKIEGHTDSTGAAAHNLELSKQRAEAVKAVLVSQFAVAAGRLTAEGLGASRPIAPNDTPQGRAQNRRVEFVRQ